MATFLELRGISKQFGGVRALSDINIDISAGEVHCLVGENGSGKSTLIKIIAGVQPPETGGRIIIDGEELSHLIPAESIRRGIQVIYQDLSLFPNMTVAENIAVECHYGLHLLNWKSIREIARKAMDQVGVSVDLEQIPG